MPLIAFNIHYTDRLKPCSTNMRFDNTARQQTSPQLNTPTLTSGHMFGENLDLVPDDDDDVQTPIVNTSSSENNGRPEVVTTLTPSHRYLDRTRHPQTCCDDYLRH